MSPSAGLDQAQVLLTASELVDAEGLDALTLSALAGRLGIKTPSLYNHIDGLPGLRRDLALLSTRRLSPRLARATIGKSGDDALLALAGAFREYICEHPGLYALTVQATRLTAPEDAELVSAEDEVVQVVLAVLAAYGLSGERAVHAVRGLRSVVHGFATLESAGGFGLPLNIDESFGVLMQMLVSGVRALAAAPEHETAVT